MNQFENKTNPTIRSGVEELHQIVEALLRKIAAEEKGERVPPEGKTIIKLEDVVAAYPETEESASKRQITEKFRVPPQKIGSVAGTGFANLNRLEKDYGVILLLPERGGDEIVVKGPAQQVAKCKKDVEDNLPWKTIFKVEKRLIRDFQSHVNVKDIENDYRVKITFDRDATIVSGKKFGCGEAVQALMFIVDELKEEYALEGAPVAKKLVSEILRVPVNKVGFVSGAGHANLNRLESDYGVKVFLPKRGAEKVMIEGYPEQVERCKQDIIDSLRRCH